MKYLVTGGAGFIGSNLCKLLVSKGHEVVVFDDLSSGKVDNLTGVGVKLLPYSMGNYESLLAEARDVDWIIHLAATVGVKSTMDNTSHLISNNINNTQTVLRTAAVLDKPIFFASTSEAYGKADVVPLKETTNSLFGAPDVVRWSYGQSKAIGEALANFYAKEKGLKFITGRIFNSVGPGQSGEYGMVLPRFVKSVLEGEPLQIYGSGLQTRSFCHVEDTVAAIYALTETGKFGEAYNIGSNDEVSILQLADKVIRAAGSMSTVTFVDYDIAYGPGYEDTSRRVPDITKINTHTGWKPTKNLNDIIGDIIDKYIH